MKLRDAYRISRRALLMAAFQASSSASPARPPAGIRCYTATATVTVLGIALVTRKAAASGFARAEEIDGTAILEFAAGSHPDRCAGLNRLGYIRELSRPVDGGLHYRTFGFLTSSREESFQEARKALRSPEGQQSYTILDSSGDQTGRDSQVATVACPSSLRWPCWPAVQAELMKQWPSAAKRSSRLDGDRPGFLAAVAAAMRRGGVGRAGYAHNDKAYTLDWSAKSASNGLTELEVHITVTAPDSGSASSFRLWYDPARPADPPVSFEYQPRRFLRVLFESAPMASMPQLAHSFPQPSANLFVTKEKP